MYNSGNTTIEVRGDEISFTKMGRVYKLVVLKYAPIFVKEISSPPDFNGCIELLYISSD